MANHTGAGKLSYLVTRAGEAVWVRVAADADEAAALRRWSQHAARLRDRHAAPPVTDVLELSSDGVVGAPGPGTVPVLVFPFLDAPVATPALLRERAADFLAVLDDLHADTVLGDALGNPRPAGESFDAVWVTRFDDDLQIIEGHVDADLHAWLTNEVNRACAALDGAPFRELVRSPIHADPWHENVLVAPPRLWLLDWEDLQVGDPVVDDAIALHDLYGADVGQWLSLRPGYTPAQRHRLAVAAWFLALDEVVDGAADWVEADDPAVRRDKESAYLHALDEYRNRHQEPAP